MKHLSKYVLNEINCKKYRILFLHRFVHSCSTILSFLTFLRWQIHGFQCPKVEIVARRIDVRVPVSSRNTTRFRLHVPEQLREFTGVRELCEQWPLSVEALRDHAPLLRPQQAARPPVEFVKVSRISSSSKSSSVAATLCFTNISSL